MLADNEGKVVAIKWETGVPAWLQVGNSTGNAKQPAGRKGAFAKCLQHLGDIGEMEDLKQASIRKGHQRGHKGRC